MFRSLLIIFWIGPLLPLCSAQGEVWEAPIDESAASPYRKEEPLEEISVQTGEDGASWYRVELPAKGRLEGMSLRGPDLPGGRLVEATAQVRGKGRVALVLYSGNGWIYPPAIWLTPEWQPVSAAKTLFSKERDALALYLLSDPQTAAQPGDFFEVAAITARLAPALDLPDVAPAPIALPLGSPEASATRLHFPRRLVPQTSRTLTLHLKATVPPGTRLALISHRTPLPQTVRELALLPKETWHAIPDLSAEELGAECSLTFTFPPGTAAPFTERLLWSDVPLSNPDAFPLE